MQGCFPVPLGYYQNAEVCNAVTIHANSTKGRVSFTPLHRKWFLKDNSPHSGCLIQCNLLQGSVLVHVDSQVKSYKQSMGKGEVGAASHGENMQKKSVCVWVPEEKATARRF